MLEFTVIVPAVVIFTVPPAPRVVGVKLGKAPVDAVMSPSSRKTSPVAVIVDRAAAAARDGIGREVAAARLDRGDIASRADR